MEKTLVLVIDVQAAMFAGAEQPYEGERILANIAGLTARARVAGVEVAYVRHIDAKHAPMQPGNPGFEVHPAIAPRPGELVVDKHACDAFHDTPLAAELAARGIGRLVVAGMQTELCIDTSCRSALHRDYAVELAGDAHSTWNSPLLTAEQIIAHTNRTLYQIPHPTREILVKPAAEIVLGG